MKTDEIEDFFTFYKREKDKQEQIAIMENYALISDDFSMDCQPIQLKKRIKINLSFFS